MPPGRARALICVVTDRARLASGQSTGQQVRAIVEQARAAAAAGADLFQIREPDLSDAVLARLIADAREAASGSTLQVLLNDRVDVAIAAGAAGVHLKGTSVPVAAARRLAPSGFLIGASTHSADESRAAARAGADFVIFGTIFPTRSKPSGHRVAGVDGLAEAVRSCAVPVIAIGGIDPARVQQVAGIAAGVAAIGWFATTDAGRMAEAIDCARSAFDSARAQQHN